MDEREDKDWEKIREAMRKTPMPPVSETFIFKVMEKIEQSQPFPGPAALLRWIFPSLGFMAAALFVISLWPMDESIAMETSLLNSANPIAVQEMALVSEQDWTGMEAL